MKEAPLAKQKLPSQNLAADVTLLACCCRRVGFWLVQILLDYLWGAHLQSDWMQTCSLGKIRPLMAYYLQLLLLFLTGEPCLHYNIQVYNLV